MNINHNFSETEDAVNVLCFQYHQNKNVSLQFINPINWKHVIEVRRIHIIFYSLE